jgi:hypothetical protein
MTTKGKRQGTALALALALALAAPALFAEDGLAVSGEVKTALVISKDGDADAFTRLSADGTPGRAQFGFVLTKGTLEVKWLIRMLDLTTDGDSALFPYAFATAGFLEDQIRISVGLIDGALWGSGGTTGVSYDSGSIARFEFKPAVLPGLSAGFFLPGVPAPAAPSWSWVLIDPTLPTNKPDENSTVVTAVPQTWKPVYDKGSGYSFGEYLSEIGFGIKYALADTFDVRFGFKLDSEEDEDTGSQEGVKLFWGVGPTIIGTFVPGLSLWVDGTIRGIGGDPGKFYTMGNGTVTAGSYTTKTGLQIGYDTAVLSTYAKAAFETWSGKDISPNLDLGWTVLSAYAGASYKVTPWLKPGLDAEFHFRGYTDNYKTSYKTANTEDPAAFDRLFLKFYTAFTVGNGFTVTPSFSLTSHSAYGTFGKVNPRIAPSKDSRLDTNFTLTLAYGF